MIKEKNFVPLTEDLLFKEVLASEMTREFLIYFLEVFTGLPKKIIMNNLRVDYEKVLPKSNYYEKNLSGDIMVYFANYAVNIEMYSIFTKNSLTKSTVYSMRIFSTELKSGDEYNKIKNVMQLNFLYNIRMPFNKNFKSHYVLTDIYNEYEKLMPNEFSIKYYRIDKVDKLSYNETEEERLLGFIGAQSEDERRKIAEGNRVLMETNEVINNYMSDKEFRYEFQLAKRQDEIAYYKEEAEKIGHKQGFAKGVKEGRIKGKIEGKIEGLREGIEQSKIEIAKSMLSDNISDDIIIKHTGISVEELNNLRNN